MNTKNTLIAIVALFATTATFAQVGIGTIAPHATAALELQSTTKGFLPPRMTDAQRDAIASPAEGLWIYNTTVNCLQWWNGSFWYDGCGQGNAENELIAQYPIGTVFCTPVPTAIVEVIGANGRAWMDRNLGASQAATSSTDTDSYGDSYQWGRAADGHQCRNSPVTSGPVAAGTEGGNFVTSSGSWLTIQDNSRWGNPSDTDKGIHDPCPNGFRLPSEAEFETERASWVTNNPAGALASPLKLPLAGFRSSGTGVLGDVGTFASYWTSSVASTFGRNLQFSASVPGAISNGFFAGGLSVRCIKN